MRSTPSSPRRIEKVSSDNVAIGFDLLASLAYMWVLTIGGLPRDRILYQCSRLHVSTAVFFEYVYVLAKRLGFEYTEAFQLVSEKARASSVKSFLLRYAAAISSGESERDFIAQDARTEAGRYSNEYERSVENLRKWTDAYAAILISLTLITVVSLVSTMIGSLGQSFIAVTAGGLFFLITMGVYVIYRVAPVEQITYDSPRGIPKNRRKARLLLLAIVPAGLALALYFGPPIGLKAGFSIGFLLIGASLLPAGFYAWIDDSSVTKLDSELPTFLRSVGNVAGATGVTLAEAMKRIDAKSMGSLRPFIDRLNWRLDAGLPNEECWETFRQESGSELVNRATRMLKDGADLGGRPDQVGEICSTYALEVTQLRAKRALTASTFSFLTVPMHATMTFILVFVLEIVTSFSSKLAQVSSGGSTINEMDVVIPDSSRLPPGLSLPKQGELDVGIDLFGSQDMTFISVVVVLVIVILTVANALAPKFAAGGSNLKIASFLSVMCLVSGSVLGVVPFITAKLFAI